MNLWIKSRRGIEFPRELDELLANSGIALIGTAGMRPMEFGAGREWATFLAKQGYYLEVSASFERGLILLKVWQFGDDEPSWEDVEIQIRPALKFAFATDGPLYGYLESIVDRLVAAHGYNDHYAVQLVDRHSEFLFRGVETLEAQLAVLGKRSADQWAVAFINPKPLTPQATATDYFRKVFRAKDNKRA
jgi:hypothetical protein